MLWLNSLSYCILQLSVGSSQHPLRSVFLRLFPHRSSPFQISWIILPFLPVQDVYFEDFCDGLSSHCVIASEQKFFSRLREGICKSNSLRDIHLLNYLPRDVVFEFLYCSRLFEWVYFLGWQLKWSEDESVQKLERLNETLHKMCSGHICS